MTFLKAIVVAATTTVAVFAALAGPAFMTQPEYNPYPMIAQGAGTAAERGLTAYGVPAPVARWAGSRITTANGDLAHLEPNPVDAGIKIGAGVSMEAIRQNGWKGGKNSAARKICNFLGC